LLRIQSCADWIGAYLISVFTHLSGVKMRPSTNCFATLLVAAGIVAVPIANAQNHAYNSVPIRNSNSPYIVEDYVGSISLGANVNVTNKSGPQDRKSVATDP